MGEKLEITSVVRQLLSFLHSCEKLKEELRHGWTSNGRQESVADHSWRLALMVMLFAPHVEHNIDCNKAIKMALIHDLVEIEAGDQYFLEKSEILKKEQASRELRAIESIQKKIGDDSGDYIYALWHEFNDLQSPEAKFVKALDKLEGYIQQNEADISTWTEEETLSVLYYLDNFCDFDFFLKEVKNCVVLESMKKIKNNNINLDLLIKLKDVKITSKTQSLLEEVKNGV